MQANTDWFRGAQYGLLFHYLYDCQMTARFDVERFAAQVADTGAGYMMFTLGQNSGHFCAPNAAYDQLTGYQAGERCSTRDLPGELAQALLPHGIRLMLYLPSNAPADDTQATNGLGVHSKRGDRYNWDVTDALQERWSAVIRVWSERYGAAAAGWWFDGWFVENGFDEPFARSYAEAAKSGNPQSLVCFNRNVDYGIRRSSAFEDYTAGERNEFEQTPAARWQDGLQWHVVSFLGPGWGERGTRYADSDIASYVKTCAAQEGVVTLDIAIAPDGGLDPVQIAQVKAIQHELRRVPIKAKNHQ